MERYHTSHLRKGRYSEANRVYHVAARTKNSTPVFVDLFAARQVVRALKIGQELGKAETLAFVVMPDHFHWLMQLKTEASLSSVVGAVKSGVAHALGRRLWQAGFYDRALRREDDVVAVARYIIANPLRAQLVEKIGDYPHWDAVWL